MTFIILLSPPRVSLDIAPLGILTPGREWLCAGADEERSHLGLILLILLFFTFLLLLPTGGSGRFVPPSPGAGPARHNAHPAFNSAGRAFIWAFLSQINTVGLFFPPFWNFPDPANAPARGLVYSFLGFFGLFSGCSGKRKTKPGIKLPPPRTASDVR